MLTQRCGGISGSVVRAKLIPLSRKPAGIDGLSVEPKRCRKPTAPSRLAHLAVILARRGEAETSLRRMLAEQRKTQKRVNALKHNVVSRYRETIRYIQSVLKEERDTPFRIKVLREQEGAAE
jgi:V/A-type H+-transporting ATPase subunit D